METPNISIFPLQSRKKCKSFFHWVYGYLLFLFFPLSFPQATNQTLLDKFKRQHEGNSYIEFPAVMEPAFIIKHYAGKVKYGVKVCHPAVPQQLFSFKSSSWDGEGEPQGLHRDVLERTWLEKRHESRERSVGWNDKVVGIVSSCSPPHCKLCVLAFRGRI